MRRLWAAGAAVVLCLALGGIQAAAQEAEGTAVTVAQDCKNIYATPIVCTWTASDPRLTGTLSHDWVILDLGDDVNTVGWADATLEGPEGNWTGRWYVVWEADPAPQLFSVLSGNGAYEGWHYVASSLDDGGTPADAPWFGVVYEGELPPYGPLQPPAE